MDRAHRIGQKKEVQVFRFCTESSIEEKVCLFTSCWYDGCNYTTLCLQDLNTKNHSDLD